jgi:plasmid stabilization system protein ParE
MLEVVFRPKAEAKLRDIADYTEAAYGAPQAKHYLLDIDRQTAFAAESPGSGSAVYGLPSDYRKVRAGAHRVTYRCTDHHLIVVVVVHEREDVRAGSSGSRTAHSPSIKSLGKSRSPLANCLRVVSVHM